MEAYKGNFPKRNRIVSGISDLVLVIEAEYRSGTSITTQYAKEQEKIVCCLPSNIDSKCSLGTNTLIQKGAKLIIKPREIIELLENKEIYPLKKYNIKQNEEIKENNKEKIKTKGITIKEEKTKNIEIRQNQIKIKEKREVKKEYEEIYKLITSTPIHINDICKISKKSIQEVTTVLTMLELDEYIEQIQGNCFIKK